MTTNPTTPAEPTTNDVLGLVRDTITETPRVEKLEVHEDALYAALVKLMSHDDAMNMLLGHVRKGEAEDIAADLTFARHIGSGVILDYVNAVLMARRAENGAFLKQILDAIKAIGRREDAKPGLIQRIRGRFG